MRQVKVVVERHPDGYVAYPLGAMVRENLDGTRTPLTLPNRPSIKSSTLRTICTRAGIPRDEFLRAHEQT